MPSYDDLVRDHYRLAAGVAARILGDAAAGEDVAQDLFIHFLQRPESLDGVANVRSFIGRSAANRALDRLRERGRRERRELKCEPAAAPMDPVEAAWREELRRRVEELPEEEREVVDLRYYRGLSVRETAREMRVSVGTVCNRLTAAMGRLRKVLGAAAFVALAGVLLPDEAGAEGVAAGAKPTKRMTGRRALVAAVATVAAVVLIGIWVGPPDFGMLVKPVLVVEADARGKRVMGDRDTDRDRVLEPLRARLWRARTPKPGVGQTFLAEGFLVREGRGVTLVEPSWREPQRAGIAPMPGLARAGTAGRHFGPAPLPEVTFSGAHRTYFIAEDSLPAGVPVGATGSFDAWLAGASDDASLPRARLAARVAWRDEDAKLVEIVALDESEILGPGWLAAWRDALDANRELARAFDLAPGSARRAEVLAAGDRLAAALGRARSARAGEPFTSWRERREIEVWLASEDGLRCAGYDGVLPEAPVSEEPVGDVEALLPLRFLGIEEVAAPDLIDLRGLALKGGARILSVRPGSPAAEAGLEPGDIVWRLMVPETGPAAWEVDGPIELGHLFEAARTLGYDTVGVHVMRGSAVVQTTLRLP